MSERAYIAIEGHAENWEEALNLCSAELMKNACIGEDFAKACVEREKQFPTGLPTAIPVAIPHAASEEVYKTAVCVLKLDEPVKFYRMDVTEEAIEVKLVFNLAVKGRDAHLDFLQKLIGFVMDEKRLKKCTELSVKDIPAYLESGIV
ncbi:PTS system galactitol-specific IIA component [Sporomusaceae bacterium BoRhaA]|uniref:PTS sugar transporter subunit IIA n=1 Tax=Pelorhabdus rhamnosifermentans TaxID=2772457 RepID=UPI001C0608F1|nr:PTS sugar transporter subunit IIA [Pelorhabdus rhamnosifermentans]MBU2701315.1 PTS system galactitol-specific IIA component [Pelorhabdus rhamnosifermentans]